MSLSSCKLFIKDISSLLNPAFVLFRIFWCPCRWNLCWSVSLKSTASSQCTDSFLLIGFFLHSWIDKLEHANEQFLETELKLYVPPSAGARRDSCRNWSQYQEGVCFSVQHFRSLFYLVILDCLLVKRAPILATDHQQRILIKMLMHITKWRFSC